MDFVGCSNDLDLKLNFYANATLLHLLPARRSEEQFADAEFEKYRL